jgi:hypothetical protein
MPMNNRDAFIFQLYCGSQKPEYPKKTTDKLVHIHLTIV